MNGRCLLLGLCALLLLASSLNAAPVILNEYNAVSSGRYLDGNDYADRPDRGDAAFATDEITNGRIQGNGGNWIELVVTEDHVDMRGWQLRWAENGSNTGTGNVWNGAPTVDQGIITLSDASVWSDLRSGTILTFSELQTIPVDTTVREGNRNFTRAEDADGTFEATLDLSTDTSFSPATDDWWIHVSTLDELDSPTPLATTVTNVEGDSPGNFSVGNDDWQLNIVNAASEVVFGPAGEGAGGFGNVGSREVAKLEENPSASISATSNYNDGTSSTFGAPNVWSGATVTQDFSALRSGVSVQPKLQAGDADQDLDFDQIDLVKVQIAAKYLTGQPATWGDGDWNGAPGGTVGDPPTGDGLFNQLDIVAAQQAGLYLQGPYGALQSGGQLGDGQTSIVYDAKSGKIDVDAPAGTELTSINIDSAAGIFTGDAAQNLGGSFDHDADNNIFKATFGASFGAISFGNVAQPQLDEQFIRNDLTVVGSLAGGGDLGAVDLIYIAEVPEPAALVLLGVGVLLVLPIVMRSVRRRPVLVAVRRFRA